MKAEQRARILGAIATARAWTDEITSGRIASLDALVAREAKTERSVRMTLSLASLSPGIVRLLLAGRFSRGVGIRDLVDLPAFWAEQERALGM